MSLGLFAMPSFAEDPRRVCASCYNARRVCLPCVTPGNEAKQSDQGGRDAFRCALPRVYA